MKVDSLSELKVTFAAWRRGKQHVREAVPECLLERARRGRRCTGSRRWSERSEWSGRGCSGGARRSGRRPRWCCQLRRPCSRHLLYAAFLDDELVALLGWAAAAFRAPVRDVWVGWDEMT